MAEPLPIARFWLVLGQLLFSLQSSGYLKSGAFKHMPIGKYVA